MTDTQQLESLLAAGNSGTVTIPRKEAYELAQKLRARGDTGPGATRLVELLAEPEPGEISLTGEEARTLREELRASGRRWVFGTNEARELPSMQPRHPGPEAAPERPPGFFGRLFGKRDA
jgi:hypothetical protein